MKPEIKVQQDSFDVGAELSAFSQRTEGVGAEVSFTGVVRGDGGLEYMEIEHYPAMTEAAIAEIADQATQRWGLKACLVIHRYGQLTPGEKIMMVATAAAHRAEAFQAAEFLMDYLKSRAPFWKKEVTRAGATWVAAKEDDEAALTRW